MRAPPSSSSSSNKRRLWQSLYFQVLVAVVVGVLIGHFRPNWGIALEPLGRGFIKLIKSLIGPIVFATVVTGIAKAGDLKKVGRVGLKALIYFEVVSTFALGIGLVMGELFKPGAGIHADLSTLDVTQVEHYASAGKHLSTTEFLLNIIPESVVGAFAKGEILQVLLFSILFGIALAHLGPRTAKLVDWIDDLAQGLFGVVGIVMRLAPLGALGAMAFTVGKYGLSSLAGLGELMICFYASALLFVLLVLGSIFRWVGLPLLRFLRFLRDEILIVLGTSSSESALPYVMAKLELLGCPKSTVGLVVPMGYSFNLDGTSIYLTLATLFVAQATGTPLPLGEELALLAVLLLTSKGAATVTGGGFITLAATLSSTGHIPVAGLSLILGVDRFMSEARAITNLIGNAVATVVLSKMEGELDLEKARAELARPPPAKLEGDSIPA